MVIKPKLVKRGGTGNFKISGGFEKSNFGRRRRLWSNFQLCGFFFNYANFCQLCDLFSNYAIILQIMRIFPIMIIFPIMRIFSQLCDFLPIMRFFANYGNFCRHFCHRSYQVHRIAIVFPRRLYYRFGWIFHFLQL